METQEKGTQRIRSIIGGAIALLGLAGFGGGMSHTACLLSAFFEIPQSTALKAFSSSVQAAWHLALFLSYDTSLLKTLIHVSGCCLDLLLALAGVASSLQ